MGGNAKLEVHVRRLTSTGAETAGDLEVYCPYQDTSVQVNECKSCKKFVTSGADAKTGRVFVECRQLTLDSTRLLRAARCAVLARRQQERATPGDGKLVTAIMTRAVACARATHDLADLRMLFAKADVPVLPVVNEHGEPVGVILRSAVGRAQAGKASDLMTRLTFVLPVTATISQVAALMALESVPHLPIVAPDGQVAGLVSWMDVLRWFAQADGYVVPERE